MPTECDLHQHPDGVRLPLCTLVELYASQSERLGGLSGQVATVVSVLERLSVRISEHLNDAHPHPALVEVAAICAQPKCLAPPRVRVPGDATPEQTRNADLHMGVAYPGRVYGAPHPPQADTSAPFSSSDVDPYQAKCGNVVLAVGRGHAAYSTDGGNTLIPLNPTATFPHHAVGGSCRDQAAHYLPGIDRFVWLMQFGAGTKGQHGLRIAAASPREIICTRCTGWTFWDLNAAQPGFDEGMNTLEVSVRHDVLGASIGQHETELHMVEIPLDEIRAGRPIHWRVSLQPDSGRLRADPLHSVRG